jgi:hybrid cluster-associated redox disulfide protein
MGRGFQCRIQNAELLINYLTSTVHCELCIEKGVKVSQKITKDMMLNDVLQMDERLIAVFMGFGMHCFGCPSARGKTVELAAATHGVPIEVMLEELNKVLDEK